MSSRIVETSVVTRRREAISPTINIHWNRDNSGYIEFWVSHEVEEEGVFIGVEPDKRSEMQPLRVTIADLLPRTFQVPSPQGGTIPVPCMLLMGAIKQAFDDLYSEKHTSLENAANTVTGEV